MLYLVSEPKLVRVGIGKYSESSLGVAKVRVIVALAGCARYSVNVSSLTMYGVRE